MAKCKSRFGISFSRIMHASYACQFALKVQERPKIRIAPIEIVESPAEQTKQLRVAMVSVGADLDQLNEIRSRLHPQLVPTNSGERVTDDNLGQGVQT